MLMALVLATGVAARAGAQAPLVAGHFGGAFGISIPTGGLSRTHAAGFNLAGIAEYQLPTEAVGIRGELLYQRFDARTGVSGVGSENTFGATVNALYNLQGSALRPYLIGGMGLYHLSDAGTRPGFNAGVGMRIPLTGMSAYFEARVHKVLTDGPSYVTVPFSFGLSF
jgi:hypothetical protein